MTLRGAYFSFPPLLPASFGARYVCGEPSAMCLPWRTRRGLFGGARPGTPSSTVGPGAREATGEAARLKQQLLPKHPMADAINYVLNQGRAKRVLL